MTTRGERNNNPGNIRKSDVRWKGELPVETDMAFEQFDTADDGIRALAKLLLNYQKIHELDTVSKIINRWAPPSENDTASYILGVAKQLGVDKDDTLDLTSQDTLAQLVKAVIRQENGRCIYSDATIQTVVQGVLA